jgi:hypothetical protein
MTKKKSERNSIVKLSRQARRSQERNTKKDEKKLIKQLELSDF